MIIFDLVCFEIAIDQAALFLVVAVGTLRGNGLYRSGNRIPDFETDVHVLL